MWHVTAGFPFQSRWIRFNISKFTQNQTVNKTFFPSVQILWFHLCNFRDNPSCSEKFVSEEREQQTEVSYRGLAQHQSLELFSYCRVLKGRKPLRPLNLFSFCSILHKRFMKLTFQQFPNIKTLMRNQSIKKCILIKSLFSFGSDLISGATEAYGEQIEFKGRRQLISGEQEKGSRFDNEKWEPWNKGRQRKELTLMNAHTSVCGPASNGIQIMKSCCISHLGCGLHLFLNLLKILSCASGVIYFLGTVLYLKSLI